MRTKIALVAGLLFGTSLGASVLTVASRADAPLQGCAGSDDRADIAAGEGTIAISDRAIVVVGNKKAGCQYMRPALDSGLLRHLAVREGTGTAYVDDEANADHLVVVTEAGTTRIASSAEITHPSWSAEGDLAWAADMTSLRLWSEGAKAVTTIERPSAATAVFSPTFVEGGELAAVGQESVAGVDVYEDDQLNNLWGFDATTERWSKWTDFEADADRWSVIRTPLARPNGSLLFVRITGRASATVQPRFQLWTASDAGARKVRELPGEMFLAGSRNGRLMWNVFSDRCGDWELVVESSEGLTPVGCGSVLVDPVNLTDPDLEVHDDETTTSASAAEPVEMGVIVGDFESKGAAAAVAETLGGEAKVVTNRAVPLAVRPGAWAVVTEVTGSVTPGEALRTVKRAIPTLRAKVFLAPLETP
jgi:hypothetical protein